MKQLQKTQKLTEILRAALGPDAELNDLAVFESISLNTLPLDKAGSIFDQGVVSATTLRTMAAITNDSKYIPLHTMHQQSSELPVGRVFHAETKERVAGSVLVSDLHTLFYISKNSVQGQELIDKLDTGVVNEVSVGFRAAQLLCSECQFDYRGPDADIMNILDQTCNEGHTIAENGVHLVLEGVDKFLELSLVSRGAADNTQILNRQQAVIAQDEGLRYLAASSNVSNDIAFIFASKGKEPTMNIMNDKDRTDMLTTLTVRGKVAIASGFAGVTDLLSNIPQDFTYDQAVQLKANFDTELVNFTKEQDLKLSKITEVKEGLKLELSIDAFVDLKADLKNANTAVTNLELEVATLSTTNAEQATNIVTLTSAAEDNAAIQIELKTALDFLKLSCQNLLVASGVTSPIIPDTVADLIATIKTAQVSLTKLPVGGLSIPMEANTKDSQELKSSSAAYKTKK